VHYCKTSAAARSGRPRSPEYLRYPEYHLMVNLVRNAVIQAAAGGEP